MKDYLANGDDGFKDFCFSLVVCGWPMKVNGREKEINPDPKYAYFLFIIIYFFFLVKGKELYYQKSIQAPPNKKPIQQQILLKAKTYTCPKLPSTRDTTKHYKNYITLYSIFPCSKLILLLTYFFTSLTSLSR